MHKGVQVRSAQPVDGAAGSANISLPSQPAFDMATLTAGGPEIVVAPPESDIEKIVADEAFLNEQIEIRCEANGDKNAPKAVELTINTGGVTGPMGAPTTEYPDGVPGRAGSGGKRVTYVFKYGQVYKVPRFVFEALAHSKSTTLRQIPHPSKPMEMTHVNEHTFSYNFACVRDPNPNGQAWREKVLRDAA
jgi:hypothetical protein